MVKGLKKTSDYSDTASFGDFPQNQTFHDVLMMDRNNRNELLVGLTEKEKESVALFCNNYPCIEVAYKMDGDKEGGYNLLLTLERKSPNKNGSVSDAASFFVQVRIVCAGL